MSINSLFTLVCMSSGISGVCQKADDEGQMVEVMISSGNEHGDQI